MTFRNAMRPAALAAFAILFAVFAGGAQAGVATSGAVLLDPFDPVPEIQFHHFGGYGCTYGCGYDRCDNGCGVRYRGCDDVCGRSGSCGDGCRRHYRHRDCDDGCDRRSDCDDDCSSRRDCDNDCGGRDNREAAETPCTSAHCYNAEHYERRWRDGDHVGQEWLDRGSRERVLPNDAHPGGWYGHDNYEWHDEDGEPPPPPPPPPHDDHDGHHH